MQDISDPHLLRALRESERRYRLLADHAHDVIWTLDLRTRRFTYVSPSITRLRGLTVTEALAEPVEASMTPASLARVEAQFAEVFAGTRPDRSIDVIDQPCKDGTVKHVEVTSTVIRDADGTPVEVVGVSRDATERVRAEIELQRSRQRLAMALEGSADGFWDIEVEPRRAFLSRRYRQIVGRPGMPGEVGVEEVMALFEPSQLPAIQADVEAIRRNELEQFSWEYQVRGDDGKLRWVQSRGKVVTRDADGRPIRISGTLTDIHDRRAAEEAIRTSERHLRLIASSFPQGSIALFDEDDRIVVADGGRLFLGIGPAKLMGRRPDEFAPPDLADQMEKALARARSGETVRAENRIGNAIVETQVSPALVDGRPSGLVVMVSQDVTARREMEENLAVASRLAAMGTLVGGIAHEINNPLAGAMASNAFGAKRVQDLIGELESGAPIDRDALREALDEVRDTMEDVTAGSRRIAAIVRDLATVGRPGPGRALVKVRDVVSEAVLRMPPPLRERGMVRVVDGGAPDVLAARGQLAQAIANVLDNAAAALPDGVSRDIQVRIGRGDDGAARIEIEDHGKGIAPENLRRIFDPFFTTREAGQGMGLGLSVAHAIVTAHGGAITVASTPGKGSTFRVEIPAAVQ
ncbi:MAG: PAS domain S-box protein [Anaeromyxobacteraceae bacterium]